MPSTRRRVLIMGVANCWDAEPARCLLADPRVERVLRVDPEEPRRDLARDRIQTMVYEGLVTREGAFF